jgi:hypothetical protein
MTTRLDGRLKREFEIGSDTYTLTIDPDGFTLVLKGRRKGYALSWASLVSGDAALATALNASLRQAPARPAKPSSAATATRKTSAVQPVAATKRKAAVKR